MQKTSINWLKYYTAIIILIGAILPMYEVRSFGMFQPIFQTEQTITKPTTQRTIQFQKIVRQTSFSDYHFNNAYRNFKIIIITIKRLIQNQFKRIQVLIESYTTKFVFFESLKIIPSTDKIAFEINIV